MNGAVLLAGAVIALLLGYLSLPSWRESRIGWRRFRRIMRQDLGPAWPAKFFAGTAAAGIALTALLYLGLFAGLLMEGPHS